jgi:hypothetical protein
MAGGAAHCSDHESYPKGLITMSVSRRVATVLSGLAMAGAISFGPAVAAAGADVQSANSGSSALIPTTDPSQGFCNQDEDGVVKLGGDNHLYECKYIWGLGWYWMPV